MMPEFIFPLSLLLLVVAYLFFSGASLKRKDRPLLILRIAAFIVFMGVLAFLIFTKQEAMAIGISVLAIPIMMRLAKTHHKNMKRARQAAFAEQTVTLQTDYLILRVNQYTKAISGEIINGRFAGARLETLTFDDLISLLADYREMDTRSAGALRSYLDRTQPPDWRERVERQRTGAPPAPKRPALSREDALSLFGLKEGASLEEIKTAHRTLMLRVHPDQGGTDYLAAMVNQAKDILIGNQNQV